MSDEFIVNNGGEQTEFDTGARRDTQKGKTRYDLIHPLLLERLADHLAKGAAYYGEGNWEKGIPISNCYASMFRHMMAWRNGEREEDHLAAIVFNVMAIMFVEREVRAGRLPSDLLDMPGHQEEHKMYIGYLTGELANRYLHPMYIRYEDGKEEEEDG